MNYLISWLGKPQSSFWSEVSSQKSVSLSAGDLFDADDDGVRDDGDEAVDVSAQVDLGHVALLEDDVGVTHQRGEVTDAVVDGDAARERDACKQNDISWDIVASENKDLTFFWSQPM